MRKSKAKIAVGRVSGDKLVFVSTHGERTEGQRQGEKCGGSHGGRARREGEVTCKSK